MVILSPSDQLDLKVGSRSELAQGVAVLQSEVEQSKLEPMHSDPNAHICHHPTRVPQGGEIILQCLKTDVYLILVCLLKLCS